MKEEKDKKVKSDVQHDCKSESTGKKPLATGHQPPATHNASPATRHSPQATDHKPLATSHPPLATDQNPPLATRHSPLKQWLKEPLLHFFILGLAVFGLHAFLEREPEAIDSDPYLVEVTSADIDWMRAIFNKKMGREPTVSELRGQVGYLIREQILSREAVAMGLDEGDMVVRRRLAQKMEFLFKDLSGLSEPSEDELREYYEQNRQKYEIPTRLSLTQVYFNSERRGVENARRAIQTLINQDADPFETSTLGDASMLTAVCNRCSANDIKNKFGIAFSEAVMNKETGTWVGPIQSAYGLHAVYIHDRLDERTPDFEAVAEKVKNDWVLANQKENTQKVYGEIRTKYRVLVEGLPYDLDFKG